MEPVRLTMSGVGYFQRRVQSSPSVRMNRTVPSLSRTQPPLGLWLSKLNNSGPPCWFQPAFVSNNLHILSVCGIPYV